MTDAELKALHARRTAALGNIRCHSPHDTLGTMTVDERSRVDAASAEFRSCDALIVAELRKRPGPVRIGDVTLWLMGDLLSFAAVDPATGIPTHVDKPSRNLLYDYAKGARPKARRVVPA